MAAPPAPRHRSLAGTATFGIDTDFAKDRFPGDGPLAKQHLAAGPRRKKYVNPAPEPDQADPLSGLDPVAFLDERKDTTRDQACDLRESDLQPVLPLDQEVLPLIVFAGLVQVGVQEFARHIGNALDGAGDRRTIDMDVEY